jgi:hypothetical protein
MDDMKAYNLFHQMDRLENYGRDRENIDCDKNLGGYIKKNYDKMDMIEKKRLLTKIIPDHEVNRILLDYEMSHLTIIPKPMSLDQFEKKALKILLRYQCRAGGFYIEDREWAVYHYGSPDVQLNENEILFENTVCKIDILNPDTEHYLQNVNRILRQISNDIEIDIQVEPTTKDSSLSWVLIWAKHKKLQKQSEISL